ncbi:dirigent protein 22-like [Abrus precatorius]|uniref:Dirigent protein n=1 Tax=Abrus precatorius TaxID=3816 RepID=A0A8B8K2X7_ABRPR|nr:dirigent protein 22-like [Abrus precatorius]
MSTQFSMLLFLLIPYYALTPTTAEEKTGYLGSIDRKLLGLESKEKISHFRFYWHEIFSGNNPTSVPVIPPLPKYNSTTSFGMLDVFDTLLTLGPELNSTVAGRAEGIYAATSQTELDLVVIMNIVLTEGKYNGSTITFVGRNPILQKVREMPIIGGTGLFRFARGYIESRTLSTDPQTRDNTIEFNIYVYY